MAYNLVACVDKRTPSMQLPAFISRLAGFADKAEAQLDALAKSQTEVNGLREQVALLTATIATAESRFKAALDDEASKAAALVNEIDALKAKVELEKQKSTEVVAAQGLPIDQLPSASPESRAGSVTAPRNLTEECLLAAKKKLSK